MQLNRRSLLFGALLFAGAPGIVIAAGSGRAPRILFVCQFGTVKSPIARELLKRRAAQRGIKVDVAARGIDPGDHLTPYLRARLAKDGIDPFAEPLRKLDAGSIAAADLVIAFDRLPPRFRRRRLEDWSDTPSMVNDYDRARTEFDARIDSLLDRLSHR